MEADDLEAQWAQRQRNFQARVVLDGTDELPVSVCAHRRWHTIAPPSMPWTSVFLLGILVVLPPLTVGLLTYDTRGLLVAGAAVVTILAIELVAMANVSWWGRRSFGYAPGSDEPAAVIGLYPHPPQPTDHPAIVAEVSRDDADRLPLDGTVVVVGEATPGGSLGIADGDYMIWPTAPPRESVWPEPTWGESGRWASAETELE